MSTQRDPDYTAELPSEEGIAAYLRAHPEFFIDNADLLAKLRIPHECGQAVSLIEHQVSVLRDQNRQLKRKLKELVHVGRENDRLSERMLRLTESLFLADSLETILDAVEDTLHREFHADDVALRLLGAEADAGAWSSCVVARGDPGLAAFEGFFKTNRPLCGRLKRAQLEFLFGERAEIIGSAALVGLGDRGRYGLLAVGSRDSDHFHPSMGTLFLSRMGAVIGYALERHLDDSADG